MKKTGFGIYLCISLLFCACNGSEEGKKSKSVLYSVDFEQTYSYMDLQKRDIQFISKALSMLDSPIVRSSNSFTSFISKILSKPNDGIKFLKIKYWTTDAAGNPTLATAAVFVPQIKEGNGNKFPILSVQHTSCQDRDASPSRLIANGPYYNLDQKISQSAEMRVFEAFSTFGYIVVVPDNIGLGDNYCVYPFATRVAAAPVVDAIRAVTELDAAGADAVWDGGNVSLIGYSEGGYTSMIAAEMLQEQYADEFNVQAAACMAGCFSISKVMMKLFLTADSRYPTPYVVPLFLKALSDQYKDKYPQYSFERMVKEKAPYDDRFFAKLTDLINSFEGSYMIDSLIVKTFGSEYSQMGPKVIIQDEFLRELQTENSLIDTLLALNDSYNWCPRMPLKMIHYINDDMIPYQNSVYADSAFAANGSASVYFDTFYDLPDIMNNELEHVRVYLPIIDKGFTWLDGIVHPKN
ncbi:MAG: lipase family protein [Bacteroidaceae bacterium]|nr:lipase family protein [Bacteroidaceae bacterium]